MDVLPGVGPTIRRKLERLGLRTVEDLLCNAPFRHVGSESVSELFGEDEAAIEVEVLRVSKRRPRPRLTIVEATVADETGSIRATWFNQPWVADQLEPGPSHQADRHRQARRVRRALPRASGDTDGEPLVPVYRTTEDVTPRRLRELVGAALASVGDVPTRSLPD